MGRKATRGRSTNTAETSGGSIGSSGNGNIDIERTNSGESNGGNETQEKDISVKASLVDLKPKEISITEPKTKEVRKPRKKQIEEENKTANIVMMQDFLSAISSVVSSRKGMEHWALTKAETENICKPLYNIIQKNESAKKLMEKSDEIALTTAIVASVLPRAFITIKTLEYNKKLATKKEKEVLKNDGEEKESNGTDTGDTYSPTPNDSGYDFPIL